MGDRPCSDPTDPSTVSPSSNLEAEFLEMEAVLNQPVIPRPPKHLPHPQEIRVRPTLALVETAFLASTASLLWLASYYLSVVPWMRIVFPLPIALVYLRWGSRSAWMSTLVTGLLLSVLMGPYLSLLFLIPFGILGVQLGFLWRRGASWELSIAVGTIVASLSFFFRVFLISVFVGEDLWVYLTSRITDLLEWVVTNLVNWGILGIGALGQVNLTMVQLLAVGAVLLSDVVYLFTVHLAGWMLLQRVGNPIPDPPKWIQVLLDE
ncbi:MAG TPA: DUF2232 domain-containing protein [Synechococcales cyanobacterium M55_K2018_004]|nr:DUF2232 domain-containing protein [Synechococcales cyanobacterium M55_K2018_004]